MHRLIFRYIHIHTDENSKADQNNLPEKDEKFWWKTKYMENKNTSAKVLHQDTYIINYISGCRETKTINYKSS